MPWFAAHVTTIYESTSSNSYSYAEDSVLLIFSENRTVAAEKAKNRLINMNKTVENKEYGLDNKYTIRTHSVRKIVDISNEDLSNEDLPASLSEITFQFYRFSSKEDAIKFLNGDIFVNVSMVDGVEN
ncbi:MULTISPECIES: hypothetical protein [Bosea]|jgi:hypothetical protein|uniref:hypothetical protein n=1 Tax=Bosea TaxID=85413 RepID=UPI0012E2D843|nr:hypothetical protein [Bosea vaviloviae]